MIVRTRILGRLVIHENIHPAEKESHRDMKSVVMIVLRKKFCKFEIFLLCEKKFPAR